MDSLELNLESVRRKLADVQQLHDESIKRRVIIDMLPQYVHEVCDRLNAQLDKIANRYWDRFIRPSWALAKKKPNIYFPVANDIEQFNSRIGSWILKDERENHRAFVDELLKCQPFIDVESNKYLIIIREISASSKHMDLIPHRRSVKSSTKFGPGTIKSQSGVSMMIGQGASVTLSGGAKMIIGNRVFSGDGVVDGKAIQPGKYLLSGSDVVVTHEYWEGIMLDKYGIEVRAFCEEAVKNVFKLNAHFVGKFDLR